MAGKRKTEERNIAPEEAVRLSHDLKAAVEPVATALAEELAALLSAVLDGRMKKTLDRLSQALSEAVPALLQRAVEDELLASSDIARKGCLKFATALMQCETTTNYPKANATGKRKRLDVDESHDWVSTEAAATLLGLSPATAQVTELTRDGNFGAVDSDAHGNTRLERTAVLLRYQQMQRR